MSNSTNTVIIGAGIAGVTAAIYLKNAGIPFVLIEKGVIGGQINRASQIENYPGISSIDGPNLAFNLYEQLKKLDIEIKFDEVKRIEIIDNKKYVYLIKEQIECQNIIVATGRKPRELGLENEKKYIGQGISFCALCDGHFFKEKSVAVVGGGDSALEEALYLSNICEKVYLLHRNNHFRAQNTFLEKARNNQKIIIKENVNVVKLNGDKNLNSIELDNGEILNVNGLFIYIGNIPDVNFLSLDNENGYIIVDKNMETNIKGIYACGDVILKKTYQLTTAIGEGATAANSIIKEG